MHAAQNPLELPSAAISELLDKLITVLPTWVIVVAVLVLVVASVVRHLSRTLSEHRAMAKASSTKEGALAALRIMKEPRRRWPAIGKSRIGDRPAPPAQADK